MGNIMKQSMYVCMYVWLTVFILCTQGIGILQIPRLYIRPPLHFECEYGSPGVWQ